MNNKCGHSPLSVLIGQMVATSDSVYLVKLSSLSKNRFFLSLCLDPIYANGWVILCSLQHREKDKANRLSLCLEWER